MASNMDGVGTFEMARALSKQGVFTCLVKTYTADELIQFFTDNPICCEHTAMSIGIADKDLEKLHAVKKEGYKHPLKYLCIDVANGYSERFATIVEEIRQTYTDLVIIAGNVVTGEMTEELILSGAIIECADAAHGLGGHIIADGGCSSSGDVAKAFGAGADFVMLGGMLAGHDEGGGEVVDGNVQFYGMSSDTANIKHFGGLKDYRSSEGRTVRLPYKCTTFIRVNNQYNRIFEGK